MGGQQPQQPQASHPRVAYGYGQAHGAPGAPVANASNPMGMGMMGGGGGGGGGPQYPQLGGQLGGGALGHMRHPPFPGQQLLGGGARELAGPMTLAHMGQMGVWPAPAHGQPAQSQPAPQPTPQPGAVPAQSQQYRGDFPPGVRVGPWESRLDPSTQVVYYAHHVTGQSQWTPPPEFAQQAGRAQAPQMPQQQMPQQMQPQMQMPQRQQQQQMMQMPLQMPRQPHSAQMPHAQMPQQLGGWDGGANQAASSQPAAASGGLPLGFGATAALAQPRAPPHGAADDDGFGDFESVPTPAALAPARSAGIPMGGLPADMFAPEPPPQPAADLGASADTDGMRALAPSLRALPVSDSVLSKGEQVLYVDLRLRREVAATVLNVHIDEQPPYYTVTLHKSTREEKQTERPRLRRLHEGYAALAHEGAPSPEHCATAPAQLAGEPGIGSLGGAFGSASGADPMAAMMAASTPQAASGLGGFGGMAPMGAIMVAPPPAANGLDGMDSMGAMLAAPTPQAANGIGGLGGMNSMDAMMAAPLAVSVGGFGGPSGTMAAGAGGDDEFGGFDSALSQPSVALHAAQLASAHEFGGFGGAPTPARGGASATADDDFGDFDAAPAPRPVAATALPLAGVPAGGLSADGFSGFDAAPTAAPHAVMAAMPSGGARGVVSLGMLSADFGAAAAPPVFGGDSMDGLGGARPPPVPPAGGGPLGGLPADALGGFDAAPSHAAPTYAAPSLAADAFGGFGATQTHTAPLSAEDFGGFDAAPTHAAPNLSADDFGGFDAAPTHAAPSSTAGAFDSFGGAPMRAPATALGALDPSLFMPPALVTQGSDEIGTVDEGHGGFTDTHIPSELGHASLPPLGGNPLGGNLGSLVLGGFGGAPAPSMPLADGVSSGGLPADAFGSFDAAPTPAAPTHAAPSLSADDFGGFDATPTSAAPSTSADDFGGFDASPTHAAPTHTAPTPAVPSLSADDFGGFDAARTPAAPSYAAPSLSADDFGGFDAAPTRAAPSSSADAFGGFGAASAHAAPSLPADDFGSFDAAPSHAVPTHAAPSLSVDDSGGFDATPAHAAPSLTAPPRSIGALDPSFFGASAQPASTDAAGHVGAVVSLPVAVAPVKPAIAVGTPLDLGADADGSAVGTDKVLAALLRAGRLADAAACAAHLRVLTEYATHEAAYAAAKANDDLEEALAIKKGRLVPLKAALATQAEQDAWRAAPRVPSAAALRAAAEGAVGAVGARPFVSGYCDRLERAAASAQLQPDNMTALAAAGTLQLEAHAACALLCALPAAALRRFTQQWCVLLCAAEAQLDAVAQPLGALAAFEPAERKDLGADGGAGSEFLCAVAALCSATRVLRAALSHHAAYWPPDALTDDVRALLARAEPPQEERLSDAVAQALVGAGSTAPPPVALEDVRRWTTCSTLGAVPLELRCALTLVPLGGEGAHAELPRAVSWASRPYHSACANLWANCVSNQPPPAADGVPPSAGWRGRAHASHS